MSDVRHFTNRTRRKKGPIDPAAIYDIVRYCEKRSQDAEYAVKHNISQESVKAIRHGTRHKLHDAAIRGRKDRHAAEQSSKG